MTNNEVVEYLTKDRIMKSDNKGWTMGEILPPYGFMQEIANVMSVSRPTISKALKGGCISSILQLEIRNKCLASGGIFKQ